MSDGGRSAVVGVQGLQVAYGDRTVLQGVDLEIGRGEIAVILGGSGCGKSTLLKSILGLVQPTAGRISLFGEETTGRDPEELAPLRRRLGVMFQYGALLNSLTVAENVALPLEMHARVDAELTRAIVQTRLAMVGLAGAGDRLPSELSGGMRKRAALARAMILDPELLFCDEPGAGLDPVTAAGIDHLLLALNRNLGTTVVVVTHELLSIQRLDGRLAMLDNGRLVFEGTVTEALGSPHPGIRGFFHPGD